MTSCVGSKGAKSAVSNRAVVSCTKINCGWRHSTCVKTGPSVFFQTHICDRTRLCSVPIGHTAAVLSPTAAAAPPLLKDTAHTTS